MTNAAAGIATDFYPRPPGGGRLQDWVNAEIARFISIHALRVEGDRGIRDKRDSVCISIHALRVEGDRVESWSAFAHVGISIHALRVEGDKASMTNT